MRERARYAWAFVIVTLAAAFLLPAFVNRWSSDLPYAIGFGLLVVAGFVTPKEGFGRKDSRFLRDAGINPRD